MKKLSLASYDLEIHEAEARLMAERQTFDAALKLSAQRARDTAVSTMTSPKFLLGAIGFGFIVGRFLLRKHHEPVQQEHAVVKKSVLGALAAAAFSLVQAQFGGPIGMARWAATKWIERRQRQNDPLAAYAQSAQRYPY